MHRLVKLEQEALRLKKLGQYREAISYYEEIIKENPNYEFGVCFTDIAVCLERIGEIEKANEYYLKGIEYDDEDTYRVFNYASFLEYYGDPKIALNYYLKLYNFEKKWKLNSVYTIAGIKNVAKKIGLSDEEVQTILENQPNNMSI